MSVLTGITATAAAAVLAVGALAGASAASADGSPSAPSAPSTPSTGSLRAACAHVDKQLARATKLQARFHAGAGSKGSIAFLQARIDKADADGQTALAHVLSDRMAVRRQLDSQLPGVIGHLDDAKATCAAAGDKA